MSSPARTPGPDITVLHDSSETMSNDVAEMMPERSTVSLSVKTAPTDCPTESEIATVAYLLWLDNGCPDGTDQEDWLRAEAMLKTALAAQCEGLSSRASIPSRDTVTEYEILAEFRWEGHWEVWESEWGGPRWVCDSGPPAR